MSFVKKNWYFMALSIPVLAVLGFVIFQPVKVVPRLSYAPEYRLEDASGRPFTHEELAGTFALYGFGYTSDPTDTLNTTIHDIQSYLDEVQTLDPEFPVMGVLVLFDAGRDLPEQRKTVIELHALDPAQWVILGGDEEALKRMIGLGFGVYYEQVPMAELMERENGGIDATFDDDAYGFVQEHLYVLVDPDNIVRAEYRTPIDGAIATRDLNLLIREQNATGASRTVNEAAHLFLCYP